MTPSTEDGDYYGAKGSSGKWKFAAKERLGRGDGCVRRSFNWTVLAVVNSLTELQAQVAWAAYEIR
jgi:hypothetical protein